MTKQSTNNLVSFRLKPDALWTLEQRLKEGQSLNQLCQEIVYKSLGLETEDELREDFETMLQRLVAATIAENSLPIINDLSGRIDDLKLEVEELRKPKTTGRKPKVNTAVDTTVNNTKEG